MRQSIAERKMMTSIKGLIDVKLNSFGLKIRKLENETRSLRGKVITLENEIKEANKLREQAQDELNSSLKKQKIMINEIQNIMLEAKEAAKKIKIDAELKATEIVKRKEEQAKQKINASQTEIINQIKEIASKSVILSSEEYIKASIDKKISKNIFANTTKEINNKI